MADEPALKRVRFGSPEIHDIPAPSLPSESDLEVPEIGLEPLDGTSEYEPSLAPEDEEDLMSDVAPEPPEKSSDRLPVRYLEELFGCTRFVRNGLSCDAYDLEAFCNLLVGRSSAEKLSVGLEREVDCVSVPDGRSVDACSADGRSALRAVWLRTRTLRSTALTCLSVTAASGFQGPGSRMTTSTGSSLTKRRAGKGSRPRSLPSIPSRSVFSVRGPR